MFTNAKIDPVPGASGHHQHSHRLRGAGKPRPYPTPGPGSAAPRPKPRALRPGHSASALDAQSPGDGGRGESPAPSPFLSWNIWLGLQLVKDDFSSSSFPPSPPVIQQTFPALSENVKRQEGLSFTYRRVFSAQQEYYVIYYYVNLRSVSKV